MIIDITYLANQLDSDFNLTFGRVHSKEISKATVALQLAGQSSVSTSLLGIGAVGALALSGGLICKKRKENTPNYVPDMKQDDDF